MEASDDLALAAGLHPSLLDLWRDLSRPERLALALALVCHAGHGWDLARDRRMAMKWWSEFLPARLRLAARTCSSLGEFTSELCSRLRGQVGSRYERERGEAQRGAWQLLVSPQGDDQEAVLDVLDRQNTVIATLVRADADAWRKERGSAPEANEERGAGGCSEEVARAGGAGFPAVVSGAET